MTKYDVISGLIRLLEHGREAPQTYCSSVDTADSFLRGIQITMSLCLASNQDFKIRRQVARERGWTGSASLPWDEMRQSGMNEKQIIHEMFTIELLAWQRVASAMKNSARS